MSFIKRNYKDVAKLGNLDIFSFNKNRKDHIYSLNLLVGNEIGIWRELHLNYSYLEQANK